MNNEIGRKITSLTLMTIMLASAFAAGAPSVLPQAAAANANLFVSTENSQFQNTFSGPMVTEVVVIDSDIKDTDKAKGEPDVTVNGKKLRMVQATDGNWYAYFADKKQAQLADQTIEDAASSGGNGLDFGQFCTNTSTLGASALFTTTVGIAIAQEDGGSNSKNGVTEPTVDCTNPVPVAGLLNNVVRENKTINKSFNNLGIQSDIANYWPIIQLYNFNPTGNVVVQYNKGGGVQTTTLKFDTADNLAKVALDRNTYPQGSEVHMTLTDIALNIDPTDEDSWTFQTKSTNSTTVYQAFNEDGAQDGDGTSDGYINVQGKLSQMMFGDSGILQMNVNAQNAATDVLTLQDNAKTVLYFVPSTSDSAGDARTASSGKNQPVTITESAPNTGVFGTYDSSDVSNIKVREDAPRGKSATISYNAKSNSILVGFGFATVDIKPIDAEWNSGEEIPVVITDSDANKNSRADEDLDVNNPEVSLIPSLRIGNPFTLGVKGTESSTVADSIYLANFTSDSNRNKNPQYGASTFAFNFAQSTSDSIDGSMTVQKFSDRAIITPNNRTSTLTEALLVDTKATSLDLRKSINDPRPGKPFHGYNLVNLDMRGINSTINKADVYLLNSTTTIITRQTTYTDITADAKLIPLANDVKPQSLTLINSTAGYGNEVYDDIFGATNTRGIDGAGVTNIGFLVNYTGIVPSVKSSLVIDLFSFGYKNDGIVKNDRINNQITRVEAEETGDNTAVFNGSLEYLMINQLNILDANTYLNLRPIADDPTFIVHQDLDAEESPRVNYNDLGADGVTTQVSDQQAAPTHSGVVSFDKSNYKIADTVTVTLEDADLNTDVDLIDIYTTVSTGTTLYDVVGKDIGTTFSNGDYLGRLLDITFDDELWLNSGQGLTCLPAPIGDDGLAATGFTLVETGSATGIFSGDFQIPSQYCARNGQTANGVLKSATGKDLEVNYVDFRDTSGNIVEVGDGAGIRANTGSVSLDRTVYPVPYGNLADIGGTTSKTTPNGHSLFPVHASGRDGNIDNAGSIQEILTEGDLTIHIQVNDPDYDTSASGEDQIANDSSNGPVKVMVKRGADTIILATAGAKKSNGNIGKITLNNETVDTVGGYQTRELGPILETTPSSGIFEFPLALRYTDGPASNLCPSTSVFTSASNGTNTNADKNQLVNRFATGGYSLTAPNGKYCILQGDILSVEYTDSTDASGNENTVTDSATFDLRNGALQSDKSVYIIGSDMILTLVEPDFDLDSDQAETYDLDLIEWDSDAATCTIGNNKVVKGCKSTDSWDPEPSDFRETGDNTGIFQVILEIPQTLSGNKLERGEEVVLEYTDWGPSGSDYVGDEDEDVNLTLFTSNFGATVELDQKVYTWTDKVYITIVAPDHNMDSNLVDTIGDTTDDSVKVATRGHKIDQYNLAETGPDTGIFTGEVILSGFAHDADGNAATGTNGNDGPFHADSQTGTGPTDGYIQADDDDGLTVSFEFSEDETVVGSALIRWNIGEVSWLEASYPAVGSGVVRVIDPDMNWNPEAVDNFDISAWSDSDAGGIDLTVTETNEATGIFEGTVFFSTTSESSGSRLRVAEGDTITAEYKDNTLPDPYTRADELDITGTSFIGTVVPPLERAPASNARVVDAFGNTLDEVSVDQQVQVTADLTNGQDREQSFAYLVQIQDENGVTVSLAWITGSLSAGQSFSPALSWIPTASGTYTATVFVWESVDNPTALSPPVSVDITVS